MTLLHSQRKSMACINHGKLCLAELSLAGHSHSSVQFMTPALPQYIVVFIVVRNMRARGMQNRTDVWKCVSQIKSLLLCAGTDRVKAARAAPT